MNIKEKSERIKKWCLGRNCSGCALSDRARCWGCDNEIEEKIVEENYDMIFGEKNNGAVNYWQKVCEINERQERKGVEKYGQRLEENVTLSAEQRIEHLEEELIDALKYCEHLKKSVHDNLTANDYQRMAMRTAGDKSENYLDNAIMGLCGEVGECADIVKKHHFQGHELDCEKLKDELSDVCWYVALLATALELTLEEVMLHNVEKLKRRYPDGFDKARSINREK